MLSDAHLHLHEVPEGGYPYGSGIGLLFSCTARPSEWDSAGSLETPGLKRFYGVHPWYCDEWSEEVKNGLLARLRSDPSAGVGEIGLDGTRGSLDAQIPVFCEQLDIASSLGRTVNVHMVSAEKETLDCIRGHAGRIPIIIHSFKSESYVRPLSELGCYFSINPRILAKKPDAVERIISSVPRGRLLLESDAPHTVKGYAGMESFISELADAVHMSPEELTGLAFENQRSIS